MSSSFLETANLIVGFALFWTLLFAYLWIQKCTEVKALKTEFVELCNRTAYLTQNIAATPFEFKRIIKKLATDEGWSDDKLTELECIIENHLFDTLAGRYTCGS